MFVLILMVLINKRAWRRLIINMGVESREDFGGPNQPSFSHGMNLMEGPTYHLKAQQMPPGLKPNSLVMESCAHYSR